jgi:ABC-2 type transport system ATP-binding protein/lipopolysaccharide transport system ATP-binding protein
VVDASVDIPVYDVAGTSLRKFILGRTVGGRFAQGSSHVIINALKNISFEAHDGDRIGLIGNNGSGKTTLLRALADVYPPTSGSVKVNGRVSTMFDATLGMYEDSTGFENIRVSGILWGLTRSQIEASMTDIIEFTELGDYLSLPLRTYSTGMKLRLAFAIATLRQPDILLLDEVIGVGDAGFYQKAYSRLQSLVRRTRILVVASHSNAIIKQLCNKAIWLRNGVLVAYGDVEGVLKDYQNDNKQAGQSVFDRSETLS